MTKWSLRAKEFYQSNWAEAHFMKGVETHKEGKAHTNILKQIDKMGFNIVGRPAVATGKSEEGNSGENFVATNRSIASYGLGPLDKNGQFTTPHDKRCWIGRFIRTSQKDIMIGSVYLPPGEENQDRRANAINKLGTLVRNLKEHGF